MRLIKNIGPISLDGGFDYGWEFTQGAGGDTLSFTDKGDGFTIALDNGSGFSAGWVKGLNLVVPLYSWIEFSGYTSTTSSEPAEDITYGGWAQVAGGSINNIVYIEAVNALRFWKCYFRVSDFIGGNALSERIAVSTIFTGTAGRSIDVTGITHTILDDPPTGARAIWENFATGLHDASDMGAPDQEVEHANHTFSYDAAGQRLKLTATGAGTSYFTFAYTYENSTDQYAFFLEVSGITAAGAQIELCREGGVAEGGGSVIINADGIIGNSSRSAGADKTHLGLLFTTTGSGDIYVDSWSINEAADKQYDPIV